MYGLIGIILVSLSCYLFDIDKQALATIVMIIGYDIYNFKDKE